jgi:hypothetical protein
VIVQQVAHPVGLGADEAHDDAVGGRARLQPRGDALSRKERRGGEKDGGEHDGSSNLAAAPHDPSHRRGFGTTPPSFEGTVEPSGSGRAFGYRESP